MKHDLHESKKVAHGREKSSYFMRNVVITTVSIVAIALLAGTGHPAIATAVAFVGLALIAFYMRKGKSNSANKDDSNSEELLKTIPVDGPHVRRLKEQRAKQALQRSRQ